MAKWLNRRQRTNSICGTLPFMAPEVAQNLPYEHSIDLWSLGILLYCMTFAQFPFPKASDHWEMANNLTEDSCENLDLNCQNENLESILKHLLCYRPELRNFPIIDENSIPLERFYDLIQ